MRQRKIAATIIIIVSLVFGYLVAGTAIRFSRQTAFEAISSGDSLGAVLQQFGQPSVTDGTGKLFSRYTANQCISPCSVRLWFENRLFLDVEAWSVSLDSNGKVIEKYHWLSP
jgi:hypothetical protein